MDERLARRAVLWEIEAEGERRQRKINGLVGVLRETGDGRRRESFRIHHIFKNIASRFVEFDILLPVERLQILVLQPQLDGVDRQRHVDGDDRREFRPLEDWHVLSIDKHRMHVVRHGSIPLGAKGLHACSLVFLDCQRTTVQLLVGGPPCRLVDVFREIQFKCIGGECDGDQ